MAASWHIPLPSIIFDLLCRYSADVRMTLPFLLLNLCVEASQQLLHSTPQKSWSVVQLPQRLGAALRPVRKRFLIFGCSVGSPKSTKFSKSNTIQDISCYIAHVDMLMM